MENGKNENVKAKLWRRSGIRIFPEEPTRQNGQTDNAPQKLKIDWEWEWGTKGDEDVHIQQSSQLSSLPIPIMHPTVALHNTITATSRHQKLSYKR